ncbi:type IX secretion system PorP/SprF family membrane protein [Pedobacter sp. AK017]|uniref:PorP/SprF family type IX secretion system membrane protein n=1 Tax=Pedobacter sp. AK017 TaxID=2723073 RepID=UPI001617716E|nr:PorP/SprF family type IX secretion system membrane protein [Pedobacter sp. AK017]MBB5438122.1 type IX secretion system PorP/SprF family membrane protein [Pedobacter sp. AK017]
MKTINRHIPKAAIQCFFILLFITLPYLKSWAQLNPMSAVYYQNQYLANPAMAGLQQRLTLNAGIRQQFSTMPGAPVTQFITADYGFAGKSALGLQVYNDRAGLLKRTRAAASFAYHLPLDADSKNLSFGLALSFADDDINLADLRGDADDLDVYGVNQRETYLDADFGMAYRSDNLQIQGAVTNMKRLLKKDTYHASDMPVFFSAVSYRIPTSFAMVEPKVVYRGVKGYDNLLDAGVNLEFRSPAASKVNVLALYHSAGSATFGIGVNWNNTLAINGMYTTNTSPLQGYTSGDYEIGISYSFFNK